MNLRAPKEHGQILAAPSLDQVGSLLQRNRHLFNSIHLSAINKSLSELRSLARREVLSTSADYHQEANEPVPESTSDVWLLAGHQPELFHPGVWFKNFQLHELARRHHALALNLVIDTDTAKSALLHVPVEGRVARIPFDRSLMEIPYEERTVQEEGTFADFPNRMESLLANWPFVPMLAPYWQNVMSQATRTPLLGERIASARRAYERKWGLTPCEAPMSRVCQTEAFGWFACSILGRLLTFHDTYNQTVREYRQEHGIRSRHHPVPDLAVDGEWLEAPFWAWRRGQTRRSRLFVRRNRETWTFKVNGEEWPRLPCVKAAESVEAWRSLETAGYKIRSRALTTTMFARLFLADLFIHGIGGGIYDELTDRIMERFYAMPAPAFLVLSATLLLPLPRFPNAAQQCRENFRQLRDMIYKPERFVTGYEQDRQSMSLLRDKSAWIEREEATHEGRVARFQHIRAINAQLHLRIQSQIEDAQAALEECQRQREWHETNARRDYAFCLYPEEMLERFFVQRD